VTGVPARAEGAGVVTGQREHEDGSTQIAVYLYDVGETDVHVIAEAIADLLVERGFNSGDENEGMNALIAARGFDWPDSPEAFVASLSDAALVVIPSKAEAKP
jgi:hypothetical protein